eukprot:TRINITY_DN26949_c0_g1_i1.p1 TRINITY_DN26949_c0_g1~~TRINITY_DN26949_c0_g1_i1.p1  ORF type:complete len:414 (+),score=51.24 TRINITY_DN26949_c0_g1_i1:1-1242(+)
MTLSFPSLSFRKLILGHRFTPLQTLISSMAGAPEDLPSQFSETPSMAESTAVNSSNSQSDGVDSSNTDDSKYGFQRQEINQSPLAGTVDPYDRHIFLCYKDPESWPSHVEGAESDRLPRLLAAELKSRKNEIVGKTRLTICEGRDGTENSNGDVLIFPDMIRYRGLTHFDVGKFVEDVIVKGTEWPSGMPQPFTGSHVFVCAHGNRDKRCGVCGPALVKKFQEEIESRGLGNQVFVSPCSHIGGHKYAGNLIIFSLNIEGKVTGTWYGYVTPDDVPILLDQHIGKGQIIERLLRGQMTSSDEAHEQKVQVNGEVKVDNEPQGGSTKDDKKENVGVSCCQGANGFSCCRDGRVEVNGSVAESAKQKDGIERNGNKGMSTWIEKWDSSDTLAALAVVGAVASVAVAFSFCYRRSG